MSNLLLIVSCAGGLFSIYLVIMSLVLAKKFNTIYFSFFAMTAMFIVIGQLIAYNSKDLETAYVGVRFYYIGTSFMATAWFLFSMNFCRKKIIDKKIIIGLIVYSLIGFLCLQLSRKYDVFYDKLLYDNTGVIGHFYVRGNILLKLKSIISYLIWLYTQVVLVKTIISTKGQFKLIAIVISFIGVFIVIGDSLNVFRVTHYNLTVWAILISEVIFFYTITKLKMFKYTPLIVEKTFDNITEAYIILDANNMIIEHNEQAKYYFSGIEGNTVPFSIDKLTRLPLEYIMKNAPSCDFHFDDGKNTRYLNVTVLKIEYNKSFIGYGFTFYDITSTKKIIKEFENLSLIDPLTNVNNRRAFYNALEEEIIKTSNLSVPLSFCMMDIDFFKSINDNYGHQAGDYVLKTIAELIKDTLRISDLVARFGGEEFCVLLSGTNLVDAIIIAEKIRKKIEQHEFLYKQDIIKVTISIGVCQFDIDTIKDANGLIDEADKALYVSKNSGRNRVSFKEKH